MAKQYFVLNNVDISQYVSQLKYTTKNSFVSQTNALGDTIADYLTTKYQVDIEVISLTQEDFTTVANAIQFSNTIKFLDASGSLKTITTVIEKYDTEFYQITDTNTRYKKTKITFKQL